MTDSDQDLQNKIQNFKTRVALLLARFDNLQKNPPPEVRNRHQDYLPLDLWDHTP